METIALILYHSTEKLQEDILTFLHFFLESPSLRPGKRTNQAENSAGPFLIPPASPGNGRSGSRRTAAFRKSSCQSQSSRTRLICIASERHDETNLLDKVNAVGTLRIRDGDHEQLALVRPGKDAGVAQLLAVIVEDDAHAAVVGDTGKCRSACRRPGSSLRRLRHQR